MDWKKRTPQMMLIGVGVLFLGFVVLAKVSGNCPFAMCANAIAPQKTAAVIPSPDKEKKENPAWTTNFKAAQEAATRENKLLFLSFSGSDWCPWCIKLDEEVLSKTDFLTWAKQNAILVQIDFPRGITQTEEQKKQNQELANTYGVEGFPTVILAGSDGRVIARTGYQRGGAAEYVKNLERMQQKSVMK